MLKRKKAIIAKVMATTLLASTLATTYSSAATVSSSTIAGANRYQTAIEISKNGWYSATNAVLINGEQGLVDALTATPYASLKNAPILITHKDKLTPETKTRLTQMGVKNVDIVGGTSVVSEAVVNELKAMKITVNRIHGINRYETATEVAKAMDKISDVSQIAVVNGKTGLPDAVSVAAPAADNKMPILLSDPNSGLNTSAKDFVNGESVSKSYIIGQTSAVSNTVMNSLPGTKVRLGGSNRQDTNAEVLRAFYPQSSYDNIYVAKSGQVNKADELVDALAVGVLAAKNDNPVMIVGKELASSQTSLLSGKKFTKITQVGHGVPSASIDAIKNTQADAEAKVTGVSLVNYKTIKLTGSELNKIDRSNISISGNTTASYSANSSGTEATVEFGSAFSNGSNTVRVTSNLGKVTTHTFVYNSDISSVQASTKEVALEGVQYVEFTVNGSQKRTVEELKALGWTVEFKSTQNVFYDPTTPATPKNTSTSGKLRTSKLASAPAGQTTPFVNGEVFDYEVTLKKDSTVIRSGKVAVTASTKVTQNKDIKSWDIVLDQDGNNALDTAVDVKLNSNRLVIDEVAFVTNVKGLDTENIEVSISDYTIESSRPEVVAATTDKKLIAQSAGNATITLKSGTLTKTFNITVESQARKLSSVSLSNTNPKLITGKDMDLVATVKDQYQDPIKGHKVFGDNIVPIKYGEATIASVNKTTVVTDNEGKAVIKVEAENSITPPTNQTAVSGTLAIANGTTYPTNMTVSVSNDSTAKNWRFGYKDVKQDSILDIYEAKNDKSVVLNLNGYNAGGYLVGKEGTILTADNTGTTGDLWVKTSDTAMATITDTTSGDIEVTAGTKTGTVYVYVYKDNGTSPIASIPLTIQNTTPKITSIAMSNIDTITKTTTLTLDDILNTTMVGSQKVVEGISMSGTKENVTLGTKNSTPILFVDKDKDGTYDEADNELVLATIVLSTDFGVSTTSNGTTITVTQGAQAITGNIVMRVFHGDREAGENPFLSKVMRVNIPAQS